METHKYIYIYVRVLLVNKNSSIEWAQQVCKREHKTAGMCYVCWKLLCEILAN